VSTSYVANQMPFNRPPRIRNAINTSAVEIPPPPDLAAVPTINWLAVGLPPLLLVSIYGALAIFASSTFGTSALLFLPLAIGSAFVPIANFWVEKNSYNKKLDSGVKYYSELINETKGKLESVYLKNSLAFVENDPDLVTCNQRVLQQDRELGQRRPSDDDFLRIRIGIGSRDSSLIVKTPINANYDAAFDQYLTTARAYKEKYESLDKAPVTLNLKELGNVGICGELEAVHNLAASILAHIATHHWPAEVQLALFCRLQKYEKWKWLRNLPHKNDIFDSALTPVVVLDPSLDSANQQLRLLEAELRRRETFLTSPDAQELSPTRYDFPALIVVVDHIKNPYDYPALALLLKNGKSLNVYGLFLVEKVEEVPGECQGLIEVRDTSLDLNSIDPLQPAVVGILPDDVTTIDLVAFSQGLGNIPWLITSEVTEPPRYVSILDLFDTASIESVPIGKYWLEEQPWGYLRAPIGKSSLDNVFFLDLNEGDLAHGPHGFIGGTTGSGKSEILKTIILSYALTHSPYDINFALIDYKGGATFKGFEGLPHVVGVITDIESHGNYARRVILALEGEVQRRKQFLLDAQKLYDIEATFEQYHNLKIKRTLPRLIIVFDEFAEFKDQHAEESKSLINLARQGRSLGIHLIICTQNPRAAVDAQVRQNSRFRISLRVASKEDSTEIIGIPDAWKLPTGKALFQVNNIVGFQSAYTGADYRDDDSIVLIRDSGIRELIFSQTTERAPRKQSRAIVDEIGRIANQLSIPALPRVWPNPLPDQFALPDLIEQESISSSWQDGEGWETMSTAAEIVFGKYDDPEHQIQPPLFFSSRTGSNDHLAVIGNSGSGKSVTLLTLAQSIGLTHSPQEAFIYCIDFSANKALDVLRDLPHLPESGVISRDDPESITRLLGMLAVWNGERQEVFQRSNVNDLGSYNRSLPQTKFPEIFLFIDAMTDQIQFDLPESVDQLDGILRFGRSSGIYVVVAANNYRDIPDKLLKNIQNRVFLGKGEPDRIEPVVGRPPKYYVENSRIPPGRGLWKNNPIMEFQVALPVRCRNWEMGYSPFKEYIQTMRIAWDGRPRPPSVWKVPSIITYKQLLSNYSSDDSVFAESSLVNLPVGVKIATRTRIGFSLDFDSPVIWLASNTARSGKTTILQTWLMALTSSYKPDKLKLFLIDFCSRNSSFKSFAGIKHTFQYVGTGADFNQALDALENEISQRKKVADQILSKKNKLVSDVLSQVGLLIVAIDDFGSLKMSIDSKAYDRLSKLISDGERVGLRTIIAENSSLIGSGDIANQAKRRGTGILLGGSDNLDLFNNTRLRSAEPKTNNLPPGRGYLIKKGEAHLIQAAVYQPDLIP
jgi:DNA segregation ATPase FtsK/SpoIIIE, S-DNA-T family